MTSRPRLPIALAPLVTDSMNGGLPYILPLLQDRLDGGVEGVRTSGDGVLSKCTNREEEHCRDLFQHATIVKLTHWNDIDLAAVPLIPDFAVELREMEEMGKIVHFVSASKGELAWFPGWEHADRDLVHFSASDVPLGTLDDPFDDRDEGWRIVIFEEGGFVYIFEDDRPNGDRFPRRYRVPRDRYFMAWAAVLLSYNPVVPLDE